MLLDALCLPLMKRGRDPQSGWRTPCNDNKLSTALRASTSRDHLASSWQRLPKMPGHVVELVGCAPSLWKGATVHVAMCNQGLRHIGLLAEAEDVAS